MVPSSDSDALGLVEYEGLANGSESRDGCQCKRLDKLRMKKQGQMHMSRHNRAYLE